MMRNLMASAIVLLLATAKANIILAQDEQPSPPTDPKAICESVLEHACKNELTEAIAITRATLNKSMEEEEWNRFAYTIEVQFKSIKKHFGEPLGWELVREIRVDETLQRYVYLSKYESGVLAWEFVFYRSHDVWKLQNWSFRVNLDILWPYPNDQPPQPPPDQPQ